MAEEQAAEKILKPEDVATLSEELQPARDHSRELGLKLGLSEALVERIHGKFPDPDECLRHILIEFTSRLKLRRTRRAIAEALRSPDINLPALADSVERSSKEDVSYSSYDVAIEETRVAPSTSTSTLARGTLGQICTATRYEDKVPPEGYQRMTTEHNWPESTKFTEVDRFQQSFIDVFGLSKSDMIYVGIFKGYWQYSCINWFTRLSRVDLDRIRDMGQEELFDEFKVYSVRVDGEYFYRRIISSPLIARKLEPRYHLQSGIESDTFAAYSTYTRSPSEYRRHSLHSLSKKEATFRKESEGFHSVPDVAHSGWPVPWWKKSLSEPSSHAFSLRSKPIERKRFADYGVKRHLIQPETEPQITRSVCLNCLDIIVQHANFEILEPLFEKYSVPVDILSTVHQLSSHYWHPSLADRRQRVVMLLYKLNRVENGYQIFYRCLRDSQLSDPGHSFIVSHMKFEAEFIHHTPITGSKESIDSNTTEIVYGSCSYHTCGLDLSLPAMTVNLSVSRVHDDYILPEGYEEMPLVSEMYKITTRDGPLPVPVTVRMEHCAVVEEEDCLIHMIAHGPPPYQFQPLPGGKFPIGESYGEIQLTEFSILTTIAKKLGLKMSLSIQVFCQNNTATFVATKNIRSLIQAIKSEYADAVTELSKSFLCDYSTEAISLSIPPEPQTGWEIIPKSKPPKIETKLIREFKEGKTPPSITLKMKWVGEGEPRNEEVEIGVEGCSIESFSLSCSAYLERRQQLSQQTAAQPQVPDTPLTSSSPSQTQTIPQPIPTPSSSHLSSSPTVSPDISSESHSAPPPVEMSMATNQLDRVVTDYDIAEICRKYLKNWEELYPYLKLTIVKESIKRAGDYEEQKRALLEEWKKKYGKRATFSDLISAAERAENRNLADNIELYAKDL